MRYKFIKNRVKPLASLGTELRLAREAEHLTVGALARKSGVAPRYVAALESEDVNAIPNLMYARQFVNRIAQVLLLDAAYLQGLLRESFKLAQRVPTRDAFTRRTPARALLSSPRMLRFAVGGALALSLCAVLVTQAYARLRPPQLQVNLAPQMVVMRTSTIFLQGKTEPEATVTVNGAIVLPDKSGAFGSRIDLQRGMNLLRVTAQKPHTPEQVVYRQVVYQP